MSANKEPLNDEAAREAADKLYGAYGDAEPNIKCFLAGAAWQASRHVIAGGEGIYAIAQRNAVALENCTRRLNEQDTNVAVLAEEIVGLRAEAASLREALAFAQLAMNHALELGYLGDGSTRGLVFDAVEKARKALTPPSGTEPAAGKGGEE
jgi:hypothetical protein